MAAMAASTAATAAASAVLQERVLAALNASSPHGLDPVKKKRKFDEGRKKDTRPKLEDRLNGILCCTVCIDLPKSVVFQCTNGHLMCSGCLTHLLADARLKDENATCPSCRTEISKTLCSRNLAVENAISELPTSCHFCAQQLPRNILDKHEEEECQERLTSCKYEQIGCPWKGPFHVCKAHEDECTLPNRRASQVMPVLQEKFGKLTQQRRMYDNIFELLSFEKIMFNDLQLRPYRTDEYIHKLFYETSRFSAFACQWVLKARVNDNQRDPSYSSSRSLSYQLVMKNKINSPISVHFLVVKGPFGDMNVQPQIYSFEFSNENAESVYDCLPVDSVECNKLLSVKTINFRFIMFQVQK